MVIVYHFAVLTAVRRNRFYVADPTTGQRNWTAADLDLAWKGEVLLVGPSDAMMRAKRRAP